MVQPGDGTYTLSVTFLQGGFTVSGSGDIQADWNEIIWSYIVDDGSGLDNQVTAIYTRQE